MPRATNSAGRANQHGRQHREVASPKVVATYWTVHLPQHWIVEAQDGLWQVPAFCGGWEERKPYPGPREELRPYTSRTATIIRRLLVRQD